MVAAVGRPAQRHLGQVAGADHKSARLVGDVHEHLSALACLSVLERVTSKVLPS